MYSLGISLDGLRKITKRKARIAVVSAEIQT
jgi:hypothetical protein